MPHLKNIRPKSFLLTVSIIELLLGTLLAVSPEVLFTKVLTPEDVYLLSVFFLIGGISILLSLKERGSNYKLAYFFSLPAIIPLALFAYKSLLSGLLTAPAIAIILIICIFLAIKSGLCSPSENQVSLLLLSSGLISLVVGLTLFVPFQYNHPIMQGLKSYFPFSSVVFIITGSLILKASKFNTTINSWWITILSLPLFLLGLYFATVSAMISSAIYVVFFLMLLSRFFTTFFLKDQEDENPTIERQLLNSYNKILEYTSLGSLLIFISSTFSPMFGERDKSLTTLLILSFAVGSVFWFHIIPHNFLSKKQILLWLNLYTTFIVAITLAQTSDLLNPFLLLYTIPIFICSTLFSKRQIIYPTWIALLGITVNFFLIKNLTLASSQYIAVLSLSYLARKLT